MTLVTYIVTVMKCVAGATQITEQRTRGNDGKHRRGTEEHQVRSIEALLFGYRQQKDGVFWSITLPKTSNLGQ